MILHIQSQHPEQCRRIARHRTRLRFGSTSIDQPLWCDRCDARFDPFDQYDCLDWMTIPSTQEGGRLLWLPSWYLSGPSSLFCLRPASKAPPQARKLGARFWHRSQPLHSEPPGEIDGKIRERADSIHSWSIRCGVFESIIGRSIIYFAHSKNRIPASLMGLVWHFCTGTH